MTGTDSPLDDDISNSPDSNAVLQASAREFEPALRKPSSMESLPSTAHDLIEVIGLQATIDLVSAYGGGELQVPTKRHEGGARRWLDLVDAVGEKAATELALSRFAGTPVYIPMCTAALRAERNRQIVEMLRSGEGVERTRRKFKMTRSAIYRIFRHAAAS